MKYPVVPLIKALYGHPDGGYWEKHCEKHLLEVVGFVPIREWRSCYWHEKLRLYLVVYVDDLKMAGPKENLAEGWRLIQKGVNMGKVESVGLYLGCNHKTYSAVSPYIGKPVRVMEYDMSDFLRSCTGVYKKLTGVAKLRKASSPFYPDEADGASGSVGTQKVETDEGKVEYEGRPLDGDASKVLMKVLYAARMARFDLLRCVGFLASHVTKSDSSHDRRLFRMMCYI